MVCLLCPTPPFLPIKPTLRKPGFLVEAPQQNNFFLEQHLQATELSSLKCKPLSTAQRKVTACLISNQSKPVNVGSEFLLLSHPFDHFLFSLQSSSAKSFPGLINSFAPFHSILSCKLQAKYEKQRSVVSVQLEAKGKWPFPGISGAGLKFYSKFRQHDTPGTLKSI